MSIGPVLLGPVQYSRGYELLEYVVFPTEPQSMLHVLFAAAAAERAVFGPTIFGHLAPWYPWKLAYDVAFSSIARNHPSLRCMSLLLKP
jgi:hypothetical protein